MQNYARIIEGQRDLVAMQRGAHPGYVVQAPRPASAPPPAPAAPSLAPGRPAGDNGNAQMADGMVFIENKIIEILREPQSAEWAAEETLNFLDRMDAGIVPQLCAGGESGLMSLFQTRAALQPALGNVPRLQEFIRAFLRYAGENRAAHETKPN
jgi:hypothetical protein